MKAINDGMVEGLRIVGEKFEAGEYFLIELISAGVAAEEAMKVLEPHLKKGEQVARKMGTIVLGTVEGDLHTIGKDIVKMLLRGVGFEVVDLGSDVPTERFIEAVRIHKPQILGMSALITISMPAMGKVMAQLTKGGLRKQLKTIVGGASVSEEFAKKIGADAFAPNAVAGVNICKEWVTRGNSN